MENKDLAKKLPKDIPSLEGQFQIEVVGRLTKKRYIGDFTCTVPRIKEQCLIDKHAAYLNGPHMMMLRPGTIKMHQMIAYLRYTLVGDMPKFWKDSDLGYELQDVNVVQAIYDKVLEHENNWVKEIWGDDPQSPLVENQE
jgi:hypothetical protein